VAVILITHTWRKGT